jgi:hypothetical protein
MPNTPNLDGNGQARNVYGSTGDSSATGSGSGGSSAPAISLPKGGGAIRGIGEKFGANPVTGTASMSVPIFTSPGRSGFSPQLSLSYDSGAGNGPFGFGWTLGLPSITRKTDKGLPRYLDADESDVFVLSGVEDLVPVLDDAGRPLRVSRTVHGVKYDIHRYRPRIEGLFARIERWVATDTGISHWRSISRDNVTTLYGFDEKSRIADPADPRHIFSYRICRTFDDKGNVTVYEYAAEDGAGVDHSLAHEANRVAAERSAQRYLKAIRYGNVQPYFPESSISTRGTTRNWTSIQPRPPPSSIPLPALRPHRPSRGLSVPTRSPTIALDSRCGRTAAVSVFCSFTIFRQRLEWEKIAWFAPPILSTPTSRLRLTQRVPSIPFCNR